MIQTSKTGWVCSGKCKYRYPVKFSKELSKEIKIIVAHNQNNIEGLSQWRDYLKWVCAHLSKTSVAWDNRGVNQIRNGVIYKRESYLEVEYEIVTDNTRTYVCIINIDLKGKDYGIDIPPMFDEVDIVCPRYDIPMNISGEKVANPATPNEYGADFVSESSCSKRLRITESDLRKLIRESLRRILYN